MNLVLPYRLTHRVQKAVGRCRLPPRILSPKLQLAHNLQRDERFRPMIIIYCNLEAPEHNLETSGEQGLSEANIAVTRRQKRAREKDCY
jgi:hypothetical protein